MSEKTLRSVALIALAIAMVTFLSYESYHSSAVNGTYRSDCCGDIVMQDGDLSYKGASYEYEVKNKAFRLTAYVKGVLATPDVQPSSNETKLLFFADGDKTGFTTSIRGRLVTFWKTH